MNLDVNRASSFGSRDWAVYGDVRSNKMDRASSASNLDENFTPALLNCSNAVRSLGTSRVSNLIVWGRNL